MRGELARTSVHSVNANVAFERKPLLPLPTADGALHQMCRHVCASVLNCTCRLAAPTAGLQIPFCWLQVLPFQSEFVTSNRVCCRRGVSASLSMDARNLRL